MKAIFLWHADCRADYAALLEEATHGQSLELQHCVYFDSSSWEELLLAPGEMPSDVQAQDVSNIQYTSGTTGLPKGVMLTHHNQVNNGLLLARSLRYMESDRICIPVPLYHCFGCVIGNMAALTSGAAMVFPNWTFDPHATLKTVQAEKCTSLYGVPAMFVAELGLPEFSSFNLTSLRTGMMAGAPCPVEVMKRVVCAMHCPQLTIGYGQTESAPVVTRDLPLLTLALRVGLVIDFGGPVRPGTARASHWRSMRKACAVAAALLTVIATTSCAKQCPLTGTVVSVDYTASTVTVKHSEIPEYMKAMTMTFPVKDKALLRYLSPGDEISADLIVSKPEYRLENIRKKQRPPRIVDGP